MTTDALYKSCIQMQLVTFISKLELDWNHRGFHQPAKYSMVVKSNADEERSGLRVSAQVSLSLSLSQKVTERFIQLIIRLQKYNIIITKKIVRVGKSKLSFELFWTLQIYIQQSGCSSRPSIVGVRKRWTTNNTAFAKQTDRTRAHVRTTKNNNNNHNK